MWGTTWGNLKNIKHLGNAHTGESTVPNRFFVNGLTNHSPERLGPGETRDNSLGVVQDWGRGAAATVEKARKPNLDLPPLSLVLHKSLKLRLWTKGKKLYHPQNTDVDTWFIGRRKRETFSLWNI